MKQSCLRCPAGRAVALAFIATALATSLPAAAADPFQERFLPFAEKHCTRCHGKTKARGELDFSRYTQAGHVTGDFRRWVHVIEFIRSGEMPPEDEPQPTIEERKLVTETLEAILLAEAKKHAGDPGVILPRRLSNTEYDLSIRDLTGIDLRPTREFPADPAAGEGFDNTGEALGMSPSLLKKYLAAAQLAADHLVLKPSGIAFAPFPVTSYNEQKKLTEQAIIDFYQRHTVKLADYLEAAWRYRHRTPAEQETSLAAWAERRGLSGKYLELVWETLNAASAGAGYLKQAGTVWEALPAPAAAGGRPPELDTLERLIGFGKRQLCFHEGALILSNAGNWPIAQLDFRARTSKQRDQFDPARFKSRCNITFDRLHSSKEKPAAVMFFLRVERAFDDGAGSAVLVRRATFGKSNVPANKDGDAKQPETITLREVLQQHDPALAERLAFGKHPEGAELDADSFFIAAPGVVEIPLSPELVRELDGRQLIAECELDSRHREHSVHVQHGTGKPPAAIFDGQVELLIHADSELAKQVAKSSEQFCRAFPNRFFYVDGERGLAAGFHLVEGFFRDDRPLMEKVLDEREQRELDALWQELDFVTKSTETLLRGFVWFERAERHVLHDARFDFLRAEDPLLIENELLTRFERVYLEKLRVKLAADALRPVQPDKQFDLVHGFFEEIRAGLAQHREQLQAAESTALVDLNVLAERAYRRSLRAKEIESLQALYQNLRKRGQGVESAVRGVFTAILMSPDFFFHYHQSPPGTGVFPLSDDALASRLSYFLWSSLPDEELRAAAKAGKLQDEAVLVAQTRRMLASPKIEIFSREFLGQWLRYRDYLSKDAINAASFPGYDEPLREAMFAEPARLTTYLIQQDKPITALLNSDETFVNGALAKHYGGDIERQYASQTTDPAQWLRVTGLRSQGRGGLFGMGVVLTKASKAERTSPVKRGFWAVHHLLGQHFPPPPTDVAELPPNEKLATKTIRELIAQHTENVKCAMCHKHFDSLGMALEGFDPIGRARTNDLAGRPVDDVAVFPSGKSAKGIPGLIDYIEAHRRQEFIRTMCRKFLGYALGRSVVLSDQPLLNEMETALDKNGYRFSVLFETVVRSPQFRQQRGSEFVER